MTTLNCFNSSFRFLHNTGITDVNTVISDFRSETVTNGSPVWTEPTSQNFKSPVDANGRFFTVILTRTTATRLEWKVTDQNGVTVCDREIDISAGGTTVDYHTGQYHAWVISRVATPEVAASGIMDQSPLAQNSYSVYVYGNAYRSTAGSVDSNFSTTGQMFMIDNGSSAQAQRMRGVSLRTDFTTIGLTDAASNLLYFPVDLTANISGTNRWVGRMYQVYLVDSSLSDTTLKTVAIGNASETGTFEVIGGLNVEENTRWALRQA